MKHALIGFAVLAAGLSGYFGSKLARGQENTAAGPGRAIIDIRDVTVTTTSAALTANIFTYPSANIGFVLVSVGGPGVTPVMVEPGEQPVIAPSIGPSDFAPQLTLKGATLTVSYRAGGSGGRNSYHLVALYK